ncbi:MAG: N-acetylmuramoyl-L-alanine amidase [Bacillota bacterium]
MFVFINTKIKYFSIIILLFILIISFALINKYNYFPSILMKSEYIVIIDPGHGSIDKGTNFENIYEKNINLEIARKLKKQFEQTNIRPILTRTEDKLYNNSRRDDIRYRPTLTEKYNADFFISLHVNNFPTSQPAGSQVFFKPGSNKSKMLAEHTKKKLVNIRKVNNRPLLPGNYYVLQQAKCPAILIETGFLSNPEDRQLLTDPEYQDKLAIAIKDGLINYLNSSIDDIYQTNYEDVLNTPESKTITDSKIKAYYIKANTDQSFIIPRDYSYPVVTDFNNYINKTSGEILLKTLLEQLKNPPDSMISPIPPETRIKSIDIKNKKAIINFSDEYQTNLNWGAEMEQLALKALTESIFTIPNINQIKILIEGKSGKSPGGHILYDSTISQKRALQ